MSRAITSLRGSCHPWFERRDRGWSLDKNLFGAGEKGAYYQINDISTLFQDAAGTIPVAANNDPVRLMKDKSPNAKDIIAPSDLARLVYHDTTVPLVQADGVNHMMQTANVGDLSFPHTIAFAGIKPNDTVSPFFSAIKDDTNRMAFANEASGSVQLLINKAGAVSSITSAGGSPGLGTPFVMVAHNDGTNLTLDIGDTHQTAPTSTWTTNPVTLGFYAIAGNTGLNVAQAHSGYFYLYREGLLSDKDRNELKDFMKGLLP